MKKLLHVFVFSCSFGLMIPVIAYALTSNITTYYPSSSGTYTKVHLINSSGGPDENNTTAPFCQWTSANGASTAAPGSGANFINAGSIFSDPATGYLEICKNDGSVASYPGACLNRFGSGPCPAKLSSLSCPNNYAATSCQPFAMVSGGVGSSPVSWSCCFTGQGANKTAPTSKSGCFSTYANYPSQPASCFSVDNNAYDIGCDTITSSDTPPAITYKRNCCFNNSSGANALNVPSTCA